MNEEWDEVQTLGDGAYGEVKLLVNRITGGAVAMKVINAATTVDREVVKKEIVTHQMLKHKNIIRYFGTRREGDMQYIFLEYAIGGELFDRIEPDRGMSQPDAQRYFRDLIEGVEYMHQRGVAHRDIKPENLLLDGNDVLKISDFGLATIFRNRGQTRRLQKRCGTLPYLAPEVFNKDYAAEPADIWSCGVVLVTMLSGELPWDKPTFDCKEYREWKDLRMDLSPWTKIDNLALSLIRKILMPVIAKRYSIQQITNHQWFKKCFKMKTISRYGTSGGDVTPRKRLCSNSDNILKHDEAISRFSCSQPIGGGGDSGMGYVDDLQDPKVCFSQPVLPENMLLSSQMQTQGVGNTQPLQRLIKRMTRFWVKTNMEETHEELKIVLDRMGYTWKKSADGTFTITTIDCRKTMLVFKANLYSADKSILVDFRRSKGDGLQFKKQFVEIKQRLADIISNGPITWGLAMAHNMLP